MTKVTKNGVDVTNEFLARQKLRWGDKVAYWATPIGRAIGHPCVDKETGKLKPDSGCKKAKDFLNRL